MVMDEHTDKSRSKRPGSEYIPSPICGLNLKRTLFVSMAVALALLPQMAHASCSGTPAAACSSFSVDSKSFSSSDMMAKATLVNKDPSKKLHLKGCMMANGKCGSANGFDITIDPGKRYPISSPISPMLAKPAEAQNFVVDISSAELLQPPGSLQPQPSVQQTGICPGPATAERYKDNTCCCDRPFDTGQVTHHNLVCEVPKNCSGKCVTDVKSCAAYDVTNAVPKPPSGPTKPPDIKVSVINGEGKPLLVTLRDVDANAVIADRALWNDAPFEITLNNKGGKGHLKWSVATIPPGLSTASLNFIPWDGASQYAVGANVVYAGNYYRATKASQHVMPPNDEYWQQLLSIDKSKPGAKSSCGEGDIDNLATGAKVIVKTSHGC